MRIVAVNKAWQGINKEVCRFICSGLELLIGHPRIQVGKPDLFRSDGVRLSDMGLDMFLEDIKEGLLSELVRLCGGHGT